MRNAALSLIAVLMLLLAPAHALAQADETVADLRRENDQLRERIAQLEATLATLLEQNKALIDETRALRDEVGDLRTSVQQTQQTVERQSIGNTPPGAEIEPIMLAEAPDDPLASPNLLFKAIQRDHDGRYPDLTLETELDQKRYRADLKRWFRATERDFTRRVQWTVEVIEVDAITEDALRVVFIVIDPESGLPYDARPSSITVDGRSALRVLENPTIQQWKLTGVAAPTLNLNTDRTERGLIDIPPFVGPYVEFGFAFRVISIVPVLPQG